ncbi:MAG: energy transducer TonB [Acidobacteriaceae bacterium]|nr:energy transducer TonB [Acidobacteriaceae bacterium]
MFTQTFIQEPADRKKPFTIFFSLSLQLSAVCIAILTPLIYTQALPNMQLRSVLSVPAPPVAAPPKSPASSVTPKNVIRRLNTRALFAPIVIPKRLNAISDVSTAPDVGIPASNGVDIGANSVIGLLSPSSEPGPAPTQPTSASKRAGPLRVGGLVAEANLVRKVQPAYPPLAKSARVQGVVEFTATISKEGNIENLQLVRGHPLLINAAKQAVLQWKYRPTLLNGQPLEVITDILVNFTLAQ